jgi:hypothetical protein
LWFGSGVSFFFDFSAFRGFGEGFEDFDSTRGDVVGEKGNEDSCSFYYVSQI